MEAVWKIEVEDFPAFIVVDDKGNDFFAETATADGHDHPEAPGAGLRASWAPWTLRTRPAAQPPPAPPRTATAT